MNKITLLSASLATAFAASSAQALTINVVNSTDLNPANTLLNAVLAPSSGINVVGGSLQFVGNTTVGHEQSATYTGFNLVPSVSGATITNPNGILLTSGNANLPTTNTSSSFSNSLTQPGTGSNAALSTLSGKNTFDQNFLSFSFTVDPGKTSVDANFVFASDEFPTQSVTDIFGFFVDGKNYAFFPGGALVSNIPQANFQNNPVGGSNYPIEYNGLTTSLFVQGLLDPALTTHALTIAVADTNDSVWDSAVFFGGLTAGTGKDGGIIDDPNHVPEPASLALLGIGVAGLTASRRSKIA